MKNMTSFVLCICVAAGLILGCTDALPDALCGDLMSDLRVPILPDMNSFQVIAADTAVDSVTLRYTSPQLLNVCPHADASMQVSAVGDFAGVRASLWWTNTDKTDFSFTRQDSTWTGNSEKVDISPVYGDNPGTLWVTVDLSFPYTSNDTSLAAVYQAFGGRYRSFYFKPDALRYK